MSMTAAAMQAGAAVDQFAGLSPILAKQVQGLIAASHGRVRIASGLRTLAQQTALYQQAAKLYGDQYANQWVADPTHSNHVKGAAVDLTGDAGVRDQLAPQFGLVAPMGWEPWHIELASTRKHANPAAYTAPPAGETNPTIADMSQSPPHVAASLAESLLGMGNTSGVGTAGLAMLSPQSDALQTVLDTAPTNASQPAAQGSTSSGGGSSGSQGANMTGKGNVNPTQLYGALTAAGLPPTAAAAFVSIAGRESGYNTGAFNGNAGTGDKSYGLFQINLLGGGWTNFLQAHGIANPAQDLLTEEGAVRAAAAIYGASGLHPWGGYKGVPWWNGTNLDAGAQASGGAVTVQDLQALGGG